MNFRKLRRKLRRKLSAILCSSMMVGTTGVQNNLAQAAGIKVMMGKENSWKNVRKYDGMEITDNQIEECAKIFRERGEKSQVTFGEAYDSYGLSFKVTSGNNNFNVHLHHIPSVNGFSISIDGYRDKNKREFGILPFSYLVCLFTDQDRNYLQEVFENGGVVKFDDENTKDNKSLGSNFVYRVSALFNGIGINAANLCKILNKLQPDNKGFGENEDNKDSISARCIEGFKEWIPSDKNGNVLFPEEEIKIEEKKENNTDNVKDLDLNNINKLDTNSKKEFIILGEKLNEKVDEKVIKQFKRKGIIKEKEIGGKTVYIVVGGMATLLVLGGIGYFIYRFLGNKRSRDKVESITPKVRTLKQQTKDNTLRSVVKGRDKNRRKPNLTGKSTQKLRRYSSRKNPFKPLGN